MDLFSNGHRTKIGKNSHHKSKTVTLQKTFDGLIIDMGHYSEKFRGISHFSRVNIYGSFEKFHQRAGEIFKYRKCHSFEPGSNPGPFESFIFKQDSN